MSVFDRLTDQNRYTGVYKERMSGDGRINGQTGNTTAQGKAFVAVQHSGRSRRLSELGRSIFAQHSSGNQQAGAARGRGGGGGGGGQAAQKPTSQMNTTEMLMFLFSYYCKFGRTGGHGADEQTLDSFNYMKFVKVCVTTRAIACIYTGIFSPGPFLRAYIRTAIVPNKTQC